MGNAGGEAPKDALGPTGVSEASHLCQAFVGSRDNLFTVSVTCSCFQDRLFILPLWPTICSFSLIDDAQTWRLKGECARPEALCVDTWQSRVMACAASWCLFRSCGSASRQTFPFEAPMILIVRRWRV